MPCFVLSPIVVLGLPMTLKYVVDIVICLFYSSSVADLWNPFSDQINNWDEVVENVNGMRLKCLLCVAQLEPVLRRGQKDDELAHLHPQSHDHRCATDNKHGPMFALT